MMFNLLLANISIFYFCFSCFSSHLTKALNIVINHIRATAADATSNTIDSYRFTST